MESEKKQKLVIDGNSFYEIDLKCLEEKKKKQEEAEKQEQENGQLQNTLAERLTVGGEDVVTGLPDANILQKKPETEKENVTEKVKDKAPKAAEKVLEVLPDDFSGMTKYFGV